MSALVIVESCFGNTRAVGEVLAAALDATLLDAGDAPSTLPDGVDLVLVGAPTHHGGLPSAATRGMADQRSGVPLQAGRAGVREWLQQVHPNSARIITFDTAVKGGTLFGSASKATAKALRRQGFRSVERGESFWVAAPRGTHAPETLSPGELDRARAWASSLRR